MDNARCTPANIFLSALVCALVPVCHSYCLVAIISCNPFTHPTGETRCLGESYNNIVAPLYSLRDINTARYVRTTLYISRSAHR